MSCFSEILSTSTEYKSALSAVRNRRLPMGVLGLSHIHKANVITAMCADTGKNAVVITADEASANRLVSDLTAMGIRALLYPARDFNFRSTEGQSREYEHTRLNTLGRILRGDCDVAVCSVEAAIQPTISPEEFSSRVIKLSVGEDMDIDSLKEKLLRAGYVSSGQVDGPGQFSHRGGIVDFFPPDSSVPCRAEFWGDTIDSLSYFETESQRRTENVEEVELTPANEIICGSLEELADKIEKYMSTVKGKGSVKLKASLSGDIERLRSGIRLSSLDRYMNLIYQSGATLFSYMKDTLMFVSESFSVSQRLTACFESFCEEIKALTEDSIMSSELVPHIISPALFVGKLEESGAIYLDNLARGSFDTPVQELVTFNARQSSPWNGTLAVLLDDLRPVCSREDWRCVVMAGSEKTASALSEDLKNAGIRTMYYAEAPSKFLPGRVTVIPGSLSQGFEYPNDKFLLISYSSNQAKSATRRKKTKTDKKNAFSSLEELKKGDYIVHNAHGIGIFEGITNLEVSGTVKDYIKIKYDKGDVFYLPVTQLDQVSKYIGPKSGADGTGTVKLNKLGGKDWAKTRTRVKSAIKDMAKELVELYAKRLNSPGYAFSPDIDMQSDFERRFEFDETEDQLRCIDEIKNDMEKPYPMDRLLCGDVGFGKTEVALRAAFKCIADGKQCAILVPTTILALQHYQTICKRFDGFPIEARMLSRFCSAKEVAKTVKEIKRGSVDVVVGTHRLISKDIEFRDLGLMIIDEEQRFGVAQKEKLKAMFPSVDVLTLSATPIPRTLNMAMTGIRDMSIIEEAPRDRQPVQTYVMEHNPEVLLHAMASELRRGGQVYYLHNNTETITRRAAKIAEELPEARIAVGHGKMSEDELSEVWRGMLEGEIDILVCTTIIETGVDIPNVNTLIIENADRMGLAQLHQIRGRVGRSSRRASAYLTFTRGKQISELATHRLDAVREFTEFGSGFKIAMRDLELRGAGNILGASQHGHLEAVGYDMYLKLLEQAVSEEKGEKPAEPERECLIDLPIDAHIPSDYIGSIPHKLSMYRRIADIRNRDDADDVLDELIDRFGEPPACVQGLITVSLIRATAMQHGIYEIGEKSGRILLYIKNIDIKKISGLAQLMKGRIMVSAAGKPHISVKIFPGEDRLTILKKTFDVLSRQK